MELACATLQASCALPTRVSTANSRAQSSCLSTVRNLARNIEFSSQCRGCHGLVYQVRLQPFSLSAVVADKTSVPDDCCNEQLAFSDTSHSTSFNDEPASAIEKRDGITDAEWLDEHRMVRACDKLIEVFLVDKPIPADWRKLLAFSRSWNDVKPHFYKRCQDRADSEDDPGMKHKLLRLGRKLKEVDEDVQRHNELLEVIRKAPEISEVVVRRRKDFTKEFFVHLYTVAESHYDDLAEQDALLKLGKTCSAAVEAYDTASKSTEALNAAELKFEEILKSPTLDAACRKIDNLAAKNQLDPALVLMMTKAWSAAKETNMVKDEAKDIMYHLYEKAIVHLQSEMPTEIRILKYLLTIEDPEERLTALEDAFTPGEELQGDDVDYLYTTPEKLHTSIKTLVNAYHFSREGTLIRAARDMMNPKKIEKLEILKALIESKFM